MIRCKPCSCYLHAICFINLFVGSLCHLSRLLTVFTGLPFRSGFLLFNAHDRFLFNFDVCRKINYANISLYKHFTDFP